MTKKNLLIQLTIIVVIVSCSSLFGFKSVPGYYLPLDHSNKFECLVLFDDYTFKHITVLEKDTLIDQGKWDYDEEHDFVGIDNMRWMNRYLLEDYGKLSYANFKWDSGLLYIGLDELNFEKESNNIPRNVTKILDDQSLRLQNTQ